MFLLALVTGAAYAACPSTGADIDRALGDAEAAYTGMDMEGFRAAVDLAVAGADCLLERPARATIASLHRFVGLRAFFVDDDPARAAEAFASARAIEPAYSFPESLVPAGHPVLGAYRDQDPVAGPRAPLTTPAMGHFEVEGRVATQRPSDRPVLIQVVLDDGSVQGSSYSWRTEPAPQPAMVAAASPVKKGPNLPLAITAGASLAVAGLSYGLAYGAHADYFDPSTPRSDLDGLRDKNNALFATSVGVGVLALGAGVGAVVAGRW